MGWTSFSLRQPVKQWFKEMWGDDFEVIDSALVERNTLYGAIKIKKTGEVFCAVFLIRWSKDHYNFSYKDMTEFAGPNVINCPKRIMKLLDPLDDKNDPNGWARGWRKKVENYWANRDKFKDGVVVKTHVPIGFTNGGQYEHFKKIGRKVWVGVMIENEFRPIVPVRVNLTHYNLEVIN